MTKKIPNTQYPIPNTSYWLLILFLMTVFLLYSFNLTKFPIFADEAIYLHWAKRVSIGEENAFISMFDGKPPLFIWLTVGSYWLTGKLLFAGRLVSVLSLVGLIAGVWVLLKKYYAPSWAWLSAILLASSPMIFFHSRLSLMDALLAGLLLLGVLVWSTSAISYRGFITGLLLGLAFMAKTPAMFLFPLPFISTVLFERNRSAFRQAAATVFGILGCALILKSSVWFPYLFFRSQDFTFTVGEVLHGQTDQIVNNAKNLFAWLSWYQSPFILIASLAGGWLGIFKKKLLILNLWLALLSFSAPFVILGKVVFPRYYLFSGLVVVLLASYTLSLLPKVGRYVSVILLIGWATPFIYALLTTPLKVQLPEIDEGQYLRDWSSGIGIQEAVGYLKSQTKAGKIKVLSEGYFGTLPDGLFILADPLTSESHIEIVGVGTPDSDTFKKELAKATADQVFYVGNENRIGFAERNSMELVQSYPKVGDGPPLQIYKVR